MHKIVMQQNLAAETLLRKGGDHWETKVTMQGMYRWIQCTKISQVESLTTKLSQSVEDNALLEQKLTRLQKKLDKQSKEKKALLDEVNRHVGLLL